MDRFFPDIQTPHVSVDNFGGVKAGVEHLLKKGYAKIAYITVDLDQTQMNQREEAYQETLKVHGLLYSQELTLKLPYEQAKEASIRQIADFIKRHPEIDAVFFATNYLGVHGLRSIEFLGLVIPRDIAVISFDDHDIFRIFKPAITVIEQPIEEIAKAAIEMLINNIKGIPLAPGAFQVIKKTTLLVRDST